MSESEYNAFLARDFRRHKTGDGVDREADLHDEILDDCRRRGWHAIHSRMDLPTTTGVGDPDFVIMADLGKVYFIECKSKTGKVTPAQAALQAQAMRLGHTVHVIRNMREYIEVVQH